jgi:xanthine dehydrogenase accessory factor
MAPSGLDLGARTPEEIALCVISEIVLLRRGGSGMRMRDKLRQEQARRLRAAEG